MSDPLDVFFGEVFDRTPVVRPDGYISSAIAQARKSLIHQETRPLPPSAYELAKWLRSELLGPYETTLLATILHSPGPVIVLRGGTGSGKSSVFGYLTRHVSECAAGLEAPMVRYRRSFLVQVDVQTFIESSAAGSSDGGPIDSLLSHIAESLSTEARKVHESDMKRVLTATMNDEADGEPVNIRHNVAAALHEACEPESELWNGASPQQCFRKFKEAAKDLHADDQLVAWLCVFRTIHRELNGGNSRGKAWPLAIVLDNLDPLTAPQQSKLLSTLSRVTSGPSWGNLRVILAVRLSTFQQHIAALPFYYYDHDSTDPADVVLVRTVLALLAPEAFESFVTAGTEKNRLYETLYELFAHLVDRGHFFELLSAMSGTSIRNALDLAHEWGVAARVNVMTKESWMKEDFQKTLRTALCKHYLEELAFRISRESQRVLRDLVRRLDPCNLQTTTLEKELSAAIMRVIRSAEPCRTIADGDQSPRAVLGRKLREGLVDVLHAGASEPHPTMACAACSLMETARDKGIPASTVLVAAERLAEAFAEQADGRSVVDELRSWVARAITSCVNAPTELRMLERRRRVSAFAHVRADAESSRFTAEMGLLTSNDPASHSTVHALNVITLDGDRICPIILRILYALRYRGNAEMTRANLLGALVRHNYSNDEILRGLKAVLAYPRRLAFSGIDDHLEGIEKWAEAGDKVVKLSSAGVGYLDVLLRVPSYLQWCFQIRGVMSGGRRAMDIGNVKGRLATALQGFDLVIKDELTRLEHTWKSAGSGKKPEVLRATELPVQSASADVFFGALDAFMNVYRITANHQQKDAPALANDASAWLELAKKTRSHLKDFFQQGNEAWNTAIKEAEDDLALIRRLRSVA